jgi:hypothetical protein
MLMDIVSAVIEGIDIELMSILPIEDDGPSVEVAAVRAVMSVDMVTGSCGSAATNDSKPSPAPARRILSGKHCTLP